MTQPKDAAAAAMRHERPNPRHGLIVNSARRFLENADSSWPGSAGFSSP
jgi:hypothetical protein